MTETRINLRNMKYLEQTRPYIYINYILAPFFSQNVHVLEFVCPARYDRRDIMFPGCPSIRPFICLSVAL